MGGLPYRAKITSPCSVTLKRPRRSQEPGPDGGPPDRPAPTEPPLPWNSVSRTSCCAPTPRARPAHGRARGSRQESDVLRRVRVAEHDLLPRPAAPDPPASRQREQVVKHGRRRSRSAPDSKSGTHPAPASRRDRRPRQRLTAATSAPTGEADDVPPARVGAPPRLQLRHRAQRRQHSRVWSESPSAGTASPHRRAGRAPAHRPSPRSQLRQRASCTSACCRTPARPGEPNVSACQTRCCSSPNASRCAPARLSDSWTTRRSARNASAPGTPRLPKSRRDQALGGVQQPAPVRLARRPLRMSEASSGKSASSARALPPARGGRRGRVRRGQRASDAAAPPPARAGRARTGCPAPPASPRA